MTKATHARLPHYTLTPNGDFVIESYNEAKPFSSFFPGVAGPHGIPMWVFYVNRAQCLCSMGTDSKDHAIMEFLPANWAYQLVSTQGFRTFVKIQGNSQLQCYEPFVDRLAYGNMERAQRMIIRPAELTLEEDNPSLKIQFRVDYFNIPEDVYAGLVRILHITNTGRKPVQLEVLDGLPIVVPFGVDNFNLKHMRRLVESFVECVNYETGIPFFKGRVEQKDKPEVMPIREGHFYLAFESAHGHPSPLPVVVDPAQVFGPVTDYSYPRLFCERTPFMIPRGAILENRLPCALTLLRWKLKPGESRTCYAIIGRAPSANDVNKLARRIRNIEYVLRKRKENTCIIERISQNNFVHSAWKPFDLYCRQNFLDNTLRGGLPVSFRDRHRVTVLHLYSRKHGDLERDYNDFHLAPTSYSQGNGNFRDVNQNRRCDLFINPDVQEDNILHFANLIQLDGFNPLIIKPASFTVRRHAAARKILRKALPPRAAKVVADYLAGRRFSPGEVIQFLREHGFPLRMRPDDFIEQLLAECTKHQESDAGHGFWTDHWTYNTDLIENFLAVYPERLRRLLLERKEFAFYDSPHVVVPRTEKYVIWENKPMQLGAVRHSAEKEKLLQSRAEPRHVARMDYGHGEIYKTTLLAKLISLVVNKLSSLDPFGMGIEMEADKPNWYDALNGLPGLFGSSISETLELKRLLLFVRQSLARLGVSDETTVRLYEEAADFFHQLLGLLKEARAGGAAADAFTFWDRATTARESYRARTLFGVSGREQPLPIGLLREFIEAALWKLALGIERARDPRTGLLQTYFVHEPIKYRLLRQNRIVKTDGRGLPCFTVLKFRQIPLPLFLEGLVHYLRVERNPKLAKNIYQRVRRSGLFDRKLQMYKVNESLQNQPLEIGRTRTFTPGWLENESVWMHMEFKYLLELLRSGLIDEFYRDIRTMLPPFMDPARYGRSILENSSFIASSANPDSSIHGTGFVARLSGSTAEFIHMLYYLMLGEAPFSLDQYGQLTLRFAPSLQGEMFTRERSSVTLWLERGAQHVLLQENTFSFMFLGSVLVVYHNVERRNTYGPDAARPIEWKLTYHDGRVISVKGSELKGALAEDARSRNIVRLDVVFS